MRILITGSRDWEDNLAVLDAIVVSSLHDKPEDVVIVHGGARGADSIAGEIARQMRVTEEVHEADWDTHGKRAGYLRNAEMVNAGADICLAFIKNNSRGATMCADLAEKAGIPVKRYIQE